MKCRQLASGERSATGRIESHQAESWVSSHDLGRARQKTSFIRGADVKTNPSLS